MKLPTFDEISYDGSLDGEFAAKKFHNKTLPEVEAMIREALECHTEDFAFMGPKAFCFYFRAIDSYVRSESAQEDESVIDLSWPIKDQVVYHPKETGAIAKDIKALVEYVIENWDKFITEDYLRIMTKKPKPTLEGDIVIEPRDELEARILALPNINDLNDDYEFDIEKEKSKWAELIDILCEMLRSNPAG